jgi:hypothetical protein
MCGYRDWTLFLGANKYTNGRMKIVRQEMRLAPGPAYRLAPLPDVRVGRIQLKPGRHTSHRYGVKFCKQWESAFAESVQLINFRWLRDRPQFVDIDKNISVTS